ncbi:hypothetical protein VP01_1595g3 [Puccinia sorghi]|uniref:Ribosomal RNA-processing protein 40 n=1 Tax=Puccinia sorghi TaxID=27349 RepID=A0A0L6VHI1_9BASI|nr:hypothetical protein VP01_1595g3 [Puccinia sorghi]
MDELTKPQVMLPGDQITIKQQQPSTKTLRLGPGLLLLPPPSASSVPNHEHLLSSNNSGSKAYVAALGDPVIGIIVGKHAEGYRVDIGTSQPASLDALAFEGATKRTKPNLKIGAVVYARVSLASNHTDTEIECINPTNQKGDGFGEMTGGILLSPPYKLLSRIGATQKFEISIGMNGRIWCKSNSVLNTLKIIHQIQHPSSSL